METNPVDEAREDLIRALVGTLDDGTPMLIGADEHAAFSTFEQAIRQEERSRYEGLLAAIHRFFGHYDLINATGVGIEQMTEHARLIVEIRSEAAALARSSNSAAEEQR